MFFIVLYIVLNPTFAAKFVPLLNELRNLHINGPSHPISLNINAFKYYLQGKFKYDSDINWLTKGFPLWLSSYANPKIPLHKLSKKVANFVNSPEEVLAILNKFIDEAKYGQIKAYSGEIKYFLSVHCVPKKGPLGNYSTFRIIRNGSFHTLHTLCINELIRKYDIFFLIFIILILIIPFYLI